ncbi:hypothetical protein BT96DRAFT_935887 [Gymnopus androsaceus JB14]|uniref:Uncharacterized protein n=1 Tax=Gymnopus androsaceus JB14 TaxID=1447944 RepID=A0A6A4I0S1_9AGAR|nr:hypothetical protein BT96DRAFT_935887 [Gymnopus androsaceus JB14]
MFFRGKKKFGFKEDDIALQRSDLVASKAELQEREKEIMKQIAEAGETEVQEAARKMFRIECNEQVLLGKKAILRREEESMRQKSTILQQKEEAMRRSEAISARRNDWLDEEERKITFRKVELRKEEELSKARSRDIDNRVSVLQRREIVFARNCMRSAKQLKTFGSMSTLELPPLPFTNQREESTVNGITRSSSSSSQPSQLRSLEESRMTEEISKSPEPYRKVIDD